MIFIIYFYFIFIRLLLFWSTFIHLGSVRKHLRGGQNSCLKPVPCLMGYLFHQIPHLFYYIFFLIIDGVVFLKPRVWQRGLMAPCEWWGCSCLAGNERSQHLAEKGKQNSRSFPLGGAQAAWWMWWWNVSFDVSGRTLWRPSLSESMGFNQKIPAGSSYHSRDAWNPKIFLFCPMF